MKAKNIKYEDDEIELNGKSIDEFSFLEDGIKELIWIGNKKGIRRIILE